jgi:hypothetical protein
MLITQPRSKKNQNGSRTSLMGPGVAVWGKTDCKKSRETVPLRGLLEALGGFCKASEDFEEYFGGVQRAPGGFGRIFRCFGGMGG